MGTRIYTASVYGLEAQMVEVEADVSPGLFSFLIVGLPDAAVQEARERVRSACKSSAIDFPRTRITVNLAPADLRKGGTGLDLPIALSVLCASAQYADDAKKRAYIGELGLDGTLRPVIGALSIALCAAQRKMDELIIPIENAHEAALAPGLRIIPCRTLSEVLAHVAGSNVIPPYPTQAPDLATPVTRHDLADIRGQEQAKRALEIAAAGGHNILLQGPPGSGKTHLARCLPGILPRLTTNESIELTRIYSVAGRLPPLGHITTRPFRAPHHSSSGIALVGGGAMPRPGEISLSHRGVLFLDELPEFPRNVLESLRQPLEDGYVTISRAHGSTTFPARFVLAASMNPCPCGHATDPSTACTCPPHAIERYTRRLSGPLLDRIDLCIEVPKVATDKLTSLEPGEPSSAVQTRIQAARDLQSERFAKAGILTNAEMDARAIRSHAQTSSEALRLLRSAIDRYKLSARAYFRALKVARTIADLDGATLIEPNHVYETLCYRKMYEK
jgi:magnesium chelatase family protein